jgi:hypothetical protein
MLIKSLDIAFLSGLCEIGAGIWFGYKQIPPFK